MTMYGTIQLPQGFDTKYLVRVPNPHITLFRAQQSIKASPLAIGKIAGLMMDSKPRIDEEMWSDCWYQDYKRSQDTIEHARLALSSVGLLLFTGNRRRTQCQVFAREWIWSGADGTDLLHEAFVKGYNPRGPNDD